MSSASASFRSAQLPDRHPGVVDDEALGAGQLPTAGQSSPAAPYGLATFQYTPAPP